MSENTEIEKQDSESTKEQPEKSPSNEKSVTSEENDEQPDEDNPEEGEPEPKPFSYIEMLDAPVRELPEPIEITPDHLKMMAQELGLIKLCWPDLSDVTFEDRTNFPESYLKNSGKERLLLLYAENFRRQFCFKYPDRKPLFLACDNECGMQKMVCTTIRPTTLPYSQLSTWQECASFIADHVIYEPLPEPVLIPRHLYSPHTTVLRQSGHSFEIATVLCSILVGIGYDAFVVSGYAIKDVTEKIMCRVNSPFETIEEEKKAEEIEEESAKYKIAAPKELQSKFLAMMTQRELDKIKAEEERQAELERQRILEEEKRPPDDLEGQRIHAWIFLAAGSRGVTESTFIEPSTGMPHPLNTDLYCGIESVWNHENYWVNMQDCSQGLASLSYDLTDVEKWEHLLIGEPLRWRQQKAVEIGEDEEPEEFWDEKHLDIPAPWSIKISIPNDVLQRRFPGGSKTTQYKRTLVEQYAPYVCDDGLVKKITRFTDFACTDVETVEEEFENRHDKLVKTVVDAKTNLKTEHFNTGRDDAIIKHVFYQDNPQAARTIFLDSKARFDGLSKIEIESYMCTEYYDDRDDKLYYRQVVYDDKKNQSPDDQEMSMPNRRPILKIIQKFLRDETKSPYEDVSIREFNIKDRKIHLKYQYGKDNVTASTRTFIKPPLSEMGEGMTFRPELTYGYQAEIGAKPPRQLQLFLLLEQQLKDENQVIELIRDFENQITDFLLLRAHEIAFCKLDVSVYNREQNLKYRTGMLEQEEMQRINKEKEVEEDIDYLSPYLARLSNPSSLTYHQAFDVKQTCLQDFKDLLIRRANHIQKQFEQTSSKVEEMQAWYTQNHDNLTNEQESKYFAEVNELMFYLKTLEIRLSRHKDLSYSRYQAMMQYVQNHPMLRILESNKRF